MADFIKGMWQLGYSGNPCIDAPLEYPDPNKPAVRTDEDGIHIAMMPATGAQWVKIPMMPIDSPYECYWTDDFSGTLSKWAVDDVALTGFIDIVANEMKLHAAGGYGDVASLAGFGGTGDFQIIARCLYHGYQQLGYSDPHPQDPYADGRLDVIFSSASEFVQASWAHEFREFDLSICRATIGGDAVSCSVGNALFRFTRFGTTATIEYSLDDGSTWTTADSVTSANVPGMSTITFGVEGHAQSGNPHCINRGWSYAVSDFEVVTGCPPVSGGG